MNEYNGYVELQELLQMHDAEVQGEETRGEIV